MFAYLDVPIGGRDLFKRTAKEVMEHDAQGLAAQLSYYFFLSLFPALLCLVAIAGRRHESRLRHRREPALGGRSV